MTENADATSTNAYSVRQILRTNFLAFVSFPWAAPDFRFDGGIGLMRFVSDAEDRNAGAPIDEIGVWSVLQTGKAVIF
ncbi:hypothetical protein CKO51_11350 [Rhodopirellula sp. SM50]|nr:hypothetical protein CKO51_11350 [Rhodopirellula sp. SM50]